MSSRFSSAADQPPEPGGDPDQPPAEFPVPPPSGAKDDPKPKNKTGYGHIGNKEVPRPDGAPKPHQIF